MAVAKLKCEDEIIGGPDATIGEFWSWAYSDVLSNRIALFSLNSLLAALSTALKILVLNGITWTIGFATRLLK
jgi:hypothetical protein